METIVLALILACCVSSGTALEFCKPATQNLALESDMPALPGEFQTRMEATFYESNRTVSLFIVYDSFKKLAELVDQRNDGVGRQIFDYNRNEVYILRGDNDCQALKINETANSNFLFSIINTPDGTFNMRPPNEVLHFNNGFPHVKLEPTTMRGIAVNHFRSCQNFPDGSANFQIDYYFSTKAFEPSLVFDEIYRQIPVAVFIEGYFQNTNYFKHEYNFFDYRTKVEPNPLLYSIPRGVYCRNKPIVIDLPQMPNSFSFYNEAVLPDSNFATESHFYYSYDMKATRSDFRNLPQFTQIPIDNPIRLIHDFNNGVAYLIDETTGECQLDHIGAYPVDQDAVSITQAGGTLLTLKNPNEIFLLNADYIYSGQRIHRGILCNVYASVNTNYKLPNTDANLEYLVENYFMNTNVQVSDGNDQIESIVPVAMEITAINPNMSVRIYNNFYDFDSVPLNDRIFDLSQCYADKDKIRFAIRYDYPYGLDKERFEKYYRQTLLDSYRKKAIETIKLFNASPLRILPARVEAHNKSILIYGAIANYPDPIKQFQKTEKTKINLQAASYAVRASEPADCASVCVNDSVYDAFGRKCLSFDFCPTSTGGVCSMYNASVVTDQSIVSLVNGTDCDHYSRVVKESDGADMDVLFRSIKEAVVRNEFDLLGIINENSLVLNFRAVDIYTLTTDQVSSSPDPFSTFLKQFRQYNPQKDLGYDFNQDEIEKYTDIFLRRKKGISIDECSRSCLREATFDCQSLTYNPSLRDCKWSSITHDPFASLDNFTLIQSKDEYTWFIRDPLYDYYEYKFQVSTKTDYIQYDVSSAQGCAYYCNNEPSFICTSFNFCDEQNDGPAVCLLSPSNIHSTDNSLDLQESLKCNHYSKKSENSFQLVPRAQLAKRNQGSVEPQAKVLNASVQICSFECLYIDSFVCRSFDFFLDTLTCYLYSQNIKDKVASSADLYLMNNSNSNHYSRVTILENGIDLMTVPNKTVEHMYSGGTIFGTTLVLTISGTLVGILFGFVYLKITHKEANLPIMKFTNPNYKE